MATVYHMASGRLEGNVYTNGWPNFTTVVAQYKGGFGQWVCVKQVHVHLIFIILYMHAHATLMHAKTALLSSNLAVYAQISLLQFFCCYTSSANNLCQLLHGTKLILSTQKNTFLGKPVAS